MRGRRTPADRKAKAVGLALVQGVPAASKALGVPQRTLRHWKADPEFAELGLSAREEVATAMWVGIQVGLEEIHKGLINPDERLRDKADATAMLIEKRALMVGEATSRTETVNPSLPPEVQRALRERFIEVTRDRANDLADGVAVEGESEGSVSAPA